MCERTEREAVNLIASNMLHWVNEGGSPHDFDDDIVLSLLVVNGIRPSSLSADLDWLLARAQQKVMREIMQ